MKAQSIVLTFLLSMVLLACEKVPITGRKQMSLVSESDLIGLSLTNYKEFLAKNPPAPPTDANAQLVKRVGNNISKAVESFLKEKGQSDRLKDYQWEFNLVNDKAVNAWCMAGGKVVVYTGLLDVTQTETALACVMGHEIAHAVARHGNERMSQGLLVQLGGVALSVALSEKTQLTQDLFLQSYGIGSQLGMLKYSRTHESEADKMGLVFMAIAGYNPQEALAFWERMAQASSGNKPPELLSTHPSDETRIADIKAFLPEAMKYYKHK
ncbi:MAG: M48 family metallopeptidase [Bacteroidetes bacterium]|nr:M48 family metallopeptidase [Bacteroidota bacterium]